VAGKRLKVAPEHEHLLLSEPARKNPSKILQVLKQKVGRALLKKRSLHRAKLELCKPADKYLLEELFVINYIDIVLGRENGGACGRANHARIGSLKRKV
jgi:hypothetical protein